MAAERSREYLETLPLSVRSYDRNEDAISAALPYDASHAVYVFYSWAREVDADPTGLAGSGAAKNFKTLRALLAEARREVVRYVE